MSRLGGGISYTANSSDIVRLYGTLNAGGSVGITVSNAAQANIVLDNITINQQDRTFPMIISGNSTVNMRLIGENKMIAERGIQINDSSVLTIDSRESESGTASDTKLIDKLKEEGKSSDYSSVKYEGTLYVKIIKGEGTGADKGSKNCTGILNIKGGNIEFVKAEIKRYSGNRYCNMMLFLKELNISGGNILAELYKTKENVPTATKINITGGHICIDNSNATIVGNTRTVALNGNVTIGEAGSTSKEPFIYVSNAKVAGSAIGGENHSVTINSGTVIASAFADGECGTAIGVGYALKKNLSALINITGGDITARSSCGVSIGIRGVGYCYSSNSSYIKISGGTINAEKGIGFGGSTSNQRSMSIELSGDARVKAGGQIISPVKNIVVKDSAVANAAGGFNKDVDLSGSAELSFEKGGSSYELQSNAVASAEDPIVLRYAYPNSSRNPIIVFPKNAALSAAEKLITVAKAGVTLPAEALEASEASESAFDVDVDDSQKPFAAARYVDDAASSLLQSKLEPGYSKYTFKPATGRLVNLNLETYKPSVTYEQLSGKTITKNNDPLLVIATVTGKDDYIPEGRLYYLFSGTLDETKLAAFKTGASTQEFGEAITRVMDTADAQFNLSEAAGEAAQDSYNGYSELQAANISFDAASEANSGRYDGSRWTELPAELYDIPVRISLGKDVVTYYADSSFSVPVDEDEALYEVNRTYEYTTLKNGSGAALALGELLSGGISCTMEYSDVEVFGRDDTAAEFTKQSGHTTESVQPIAADMDYGDIESRMHDIKQVLLDNINDGDTSNDFWNKPSSAFGLYITYEYIAANVCLSRYVNTATVPKLYEDAFSPAKLLTPGAEQIVPEYQLYKKSAGSDTWEPVSETDGKYEFEYDDSIKLVVRDPEGTETTGKYEFRVKDGSIIPFGGPTGEEGWNLSEEYAAGADNNLSGVETTIDIVRQYDGTYSQSTQTITVKINGKLDAAVPVIEMEDELSHMRDGSDITVEASATVSDGGTLSYQWYELQKDGSKTKLEGQTGSSLVIPADEIEGIAHATVKTYVLEVTNTNDSVNGDTEATASKSIEIKFLTPGHSSNPPLISVPEDEPALKPEEPVSEEDNMGQDELQSPGKPQKPNYDSEGMSPLRGEDGESVTAPKTADTNNLPLYLTLMLGAAGILQALCRRQKNRQ